MTKSVFSDIPKNPIILVFAVLAYTFSVQPLFSQEISTPTENIPIDTLHIDAGGFKLYMLKKGIEKGLTVIMEDGMCGRGTRWNRLDDSIAVKNTVVTYSRAFLGKSEKGNPDRRAENVVRELKTVLDNAGISEPYILIGYSLGGHYTKAFARAYLDEVKGILLIDPLNTAKFYEEYRRDFTEVYEIESSYLKETKKEHPCYNEIQFLTDDSSYGDDSMPIHIPTYMLISALAMDLEPFLEDLMDKKEKQDIDIDKLKDMNNAVQEAWVRHHLKWASAFPNVKTEVTDECTHAMHAERLDIVWNAFLKLMSDVSE